METGEFGPIYRQFEKKPKEAILFLKEKTNGECINAFCGDKFMLIIKTKWNDKNKRFVMTAFDLRPMSRKNPKRAEQARKKGI